MANKMSRKARPDNHPLTSKKPTAGPTGGTSDLKKLQTDLQLAKARHKHAEECRLLKAQADEYRHKTAMLVTDQARVQPRSQQSEEVLHYISVVKQEPGVPISRKRKMPQEIIDLCDSDSDMSEDETNKASASSSTDSEHVTSAPGVDDNGSSAASKANGSADQAHEAPEGSGRLALTDISRSSSKHGMPRTFNMPTSVKEVGADATAPSVAQPVVRSYWKERLDAHVQPESSAITSEPTPTTADPSVPTNSSAGIVATAPKSPKVRTSSSKPISDNPHRYRGPEITVISLQAIWAHLDHAWGQGSYTAKTVAQLSGWWAASVVASSHRLDKHQVWLLLFAQFKWWKALQEQWEKFDALPAKNRPIIGKMRAVRLKKESLAVNAEVALMTEGLVMESAAIYRLGLVVKKEKVEPKAAEKKGEGGNKKQTEKKTTGKGGGVKGHQAKQVKFGSEMATGKKAGGPQEQGAEEGDVDELTSDSEEEAED